MAHCRRHGITPVASTDENYPPLLREIPDYPHVIYVQGDPTALCGTMISMVGTRGRTSYGERMCRELVAGLAERVHGLCVVSGLAFGIDGDCHRAALACGAATVAVLANALPGSPPRPMRRSPAKSSHPEVRWSRNSTPGHGRTAVSSWPATASSLP